VIERILMPVVTLFAPISPIAWIPFAMMVFGIGDWPAIFVVIISVYFLMTVATVSSIRSVNPSHVMWARQYGASRKQVFRHVILPSILPSLFLILRINLFAAWMSVLAAEMVGVSQGLGAMIMVGRALFNMKIVLIAMILIGLCGYFLDRLLLFVQRRVFWWKKEALLT
jgi:NitT/TauT family transport system permease protein